MNLQCEPCKAISWDEQMSKKWQNVKLDKERMSNLAPKCVVRIARCSVPHPVIQLNLSNPIPRITATEHQKDVFLNPPLFCFFWCHQETPPSHISNLRFTRTLVSTFIPSFLLHNLSFLLRRWSQSTVQLFIHWHRFLICVHQTHSHSFDFIKLIPVRCLPIVQILQVFSHSFVSQSLHFQISKLSVVNRWRSVEASDLHPLPGLSDPSHRVAGSTRHLRRLACVVLSEKRWNVDWGNSELTWNLRGERHTRGDVFGVPASTKYFHSKVV